MLNSKELAVICGLSDEEIENLSLVEYPPEISWAPPILMFREGEEGTLLWLKNPGTQCLGERKIGSLYFEPICGRCGVAIMSPEEERFSNSDWSGESTPESSERYRRLEELAMNKTNSLLDSIWRAIFSTAEKMGIKRLFLTSSGVGKVLVKDWGE